MPADVLKNDDGIVDDAPDCDHHAAEREDVQGDSLPPQHDQRDHQGERYGHRGHDGCAAAAKEREDDKDREDGAQQALSEDDGNRVGDRGCLIRQQLELDVVADRCFDRGQRALDFVGDGDGVGVRALRDLEADSGLAVRARDRVRRDRDERDLAELPDRDRGDGLAAGGRRRDDDDVRYLVQARQVSRDLEGNRAGALPQRTY